MPPALNPIDNILFVASIDWCGVFRKAEELRFVPGRFCRGGTYAPDPVKSRTDGYGHYAVQRARCAGSPNRRDPMRVPARQISRAASGSAC